MHSGIFLHKPIAAYSLPLPKVYFTKLTIPKKGDNE